MKYIASFVVVFCWIFFVLLVFEIHYRSVVIRRFQAEIFQGYTDKDLDSAYMKGIMAQPLKLPAEVKKDQAYFIKAFYYSNDYTVTKVQIYPPRLP